jgi:hypothetical protein
LIIFFGQQRALVSQGLVDGVVGLEDELPGEPLHRVGKHTVVVNR